MKLRRYPTILVCGFIIGACSSSLNSSDTAGQDPGEQALDSLSTVDMETQDSSSGVADSFVPDTPGSDAATQEPPTVVVEITQTGAWLATTEHYAVTAGTDKEEAGIIAQVLEAAFDDFLRVFDGATPGAQDFPLKVHVYATKDDFNANVQYPDGTPTSGGGYYDPNTQIASLYVQPSVYYTRSLALHEAAHQYHDLARLAPGSDPPTWYVEAVASWLQIYDWDGIETTLGVTALASLEDYPEQGLQDLQSCTDLGGVIEGTGAWTRPLGRLIFRYLDAQYSDGFTAFRQAVDAGQANTRALFEEHIGDPQSLREEILAWAPSDQEPFDIVFISWTHIGPDAVHAKADPAILTFLAGNSPYNSMSASFGLSDVEEKAGVLLAFDAPDQYTMAVFDGSGQLEVIAVNAGVWSWLETSPIAQTDVVTVEVSMNLLTVNGVVYGPYDIGPGNPGLVSWGSEILFEGILFD